METRSDPVTKCISVTPSDVADFTDSGATVKCRGISVDGSGTVAFKDENGVTRVTGNLQEFVIHPISTKRIMATGTTATGIVVYW
jgi:hypothetical protein